MSTLGAVQKALIESKKAEAKKKRDARLKLMAERKSAEGNNRNGSILRTRHLMDAREEIDYIGPSGNMPIDLKGGKTSIGSDRNANGGNHDRREIDVVSGRKPVMGVTDGGGVVHASINGNDTNTNNITNISNNNNNVNNDNNKHNNSSSKNSNNKRGWNDDLDGLMDDADFWDLAAMNENDAEREKEKAKRLKAQQVSYTNSTSSNHGDGEKKGANAKAPRSRIDTNAGFLMPNEREIAETDAKLQPRRRKDRDTLDQYDDVRKTCKDCGKVFYTSYLEKNFGINVCDQCKRIDKAKDDVYGLVTKTTAKKEYLLTDGDLENRDYSLRFVTMANPGGSHFAPMKLYSRLQVEEISFKRFGGEVGLDLEIEKRQETKIIGQKQKYQKKVQDLKRTTLAKIHTVERHVHEWGPPKHDAATDMSEKKCIECGVSVQYCSM
ncbi:hypothetical protein SARC_09367 [Sphaeroforma arctica JP610]|uniref:XPA C-terminal domain-containing protein n=1 Tax=Sphaeroforma arctica JP610 TaxID=667725 RepID=A0A0L0FN51_9EUKA|nr:hypothetical protein SARC_09367 [Sphaeroforma arctica JP610]KNC78197.1 hypothetical protein SARC_09367 [Sphaeroforma arctica JP610]|eukprot:XP_014152099.1 hypothetical protein SARC_09367 [Sphaeroforma arctica JP610]